MNLTQSIIHTSESLNGLRLQEPNLLPFTVTASEWAEESLNGRPDAPEKIDEYIAKISAAAFQNRENSFCTWEPRFIGRDIHKSSFKKDFSALIQKVATDFHSGCLTMPQLKNGPISYDTIRISLKAYTKDETVERIRTFEKSFTVVYDNPSEQKKEASSDQQKSSFKYNDEEMSSIIALQMAAFSKK